MSTVRTYNSSEKHPTMGIKRMRFNSGVEKDFATSYFYPVSVITDGLTALGKQP